MIVAVEVVGSASSGLKEGFAFVPGKASSTMSDTNQTRYTTLPLGVCPAVVTTIKVFANTIGIASSFHRTKPCYDCMSCLYKSEVMTLFIEQT